MKKVTPESIKLLKRAGEKISSITAYDYSTARIIDNAGIDMVLVGDSAAMVMLGLPTTHGIGIDEMKMFTSAVSRGVKRAMVVADMPFGSYQASIEQGVKNACELIIAGANAVKIEGGSNYIVELTERLTTQGVPVLSHLGFTPQFLNALGGYKVQAKGAEQTEFILKQALKLQDAGAFGVVLEMVSSEAAKYITGRLEIPTIGIGAGKDTDGQILVIDDVLGKYKDFEPKFVKRYADLESIISDAIKSYISDVKEERFPEEEHIFKMNEAERGKLEYAGNNEGARAQ